MRAKRDTTDGVIDDVAWVRTNGTRLLDAFHDGRALTDSPRANDDATIECDSDGACSRFQDTLLF